MVRIFIKALLALFAIYVVILYWGKNGYAETGTAAIEYHGFLNGVYFGALMITLFIDVSSSKRSISYYLSTVAAFAGLGFLMPTVEGKIMASVLALLLIVFWFLHVWRLLKFAGHNDSR